MLDKFQIFMSIILLIAVGFMGFAFCHIHICQEAAAKQVKLDSCGNGGK